MQEKIDIHSNKVFIGEVLSRYFKQIDVNHFDRDVRYFLNHLNENHKSVISIKAQEVFIDGTQILGPFDLKEFESDTSIWLDFNLTANSIYLQHSPLNSHEPSQEERIESITVPFSIICNVITPKCDNTRPPFKYIFALNGELITTSKSSRIAKKPNMLKVIFEDIVSHQRILTMMEKAFPDAVSRFYLNENDTFALFIVILEK